MKETHVNQLQYIIMCSIIKQTPFRAQGTLCIELLLGFQKRTEI